MTFTREAEDYLRLVTSLLPLSDESTGWRSSRPLRPDEPPQGWKLHVSATVRNARPVLEACARYLLARDVAFKACGTLEMLAQLNSGLEFGFSQVGKFMTVYPASSSVALETAEGLDRLTSDLAAPRVPYDLPYRPGGSVHYRYGAFTKIEMVMQDGSTGLGVRDPSGKLWTDERAPGKAVPVWIQNPFPVYDDAVAPDSPLATQFLAYEALSQRGKGGVYRAVDMRAIPAKECILKEGRPAGEEDIAGNDGRSLVHREEHALRSLAHHVPVPTVLGAFEVDGHAYLAMEKIEGESLMAHCSYPRRKIPLEEADTLAAQAARLVARTHAAGWVWRDCKPFNLMLTASGALRPIDFEGAVRTDQPSNDLWGTPGYMAPEIRGNYETADNVPEDLFALGATLHQLFSSVVPARTDSEGRHRVELHRPLGILRRGVAPSTKAVIAALLAPVPADRPTAAEAEAVLSAREGAPVAPRRPPRPRPARADQPAARLPRVPPSRRLGKPLAALV